MRIAYFFWLLVIFLVVTSFALGQSREIPASELLNLEKKADALIKTTSHRLTVNMEYFDDRNRPGRNTRYYLEEVQLPEKRHTVEDELHGDKRTKREELWVNKALYVRIDDGEWMKYSGGAGSVSFDIEQGRVTTTYRYIGKDNLTGGQTDLYEIEMHRLANKYSPTSPNGMVEIHYVRRTREWFWPDGKLARKQVENEFAGGRKELSREISLYEYDPTIKIEAPIK